MGTSAGVVFCEDQGKDFEQPGDTYCIGLGGHPNNLLPELKSKVGSAKEDYEEDWYKELKDDFKQGYSGWRNCSTQHAMAAQYTYLIRSDGEIFVNHNGIWTHENMIGKNMADLITEVKQ